MNYAAIYSALIGKGLCRIQSPDLSLERHHIWPKSLGGPDHPTNIVLLTPKEHYMAHLLLWRMGNENQILAVSNFLDDSRNPLKPHRFGTVTTKKWQRRAITYQRARNMREANRQAVSRRYCRDMQTIDENYIDTMFTIAGVG